MHYRSTFMQIKLYFILILACFTNIEAITIMLDPAGDGQHTGHEIDGTFERTITWQCAQEIKQQLIQIDPSIHVVMTRSPGDTIEPLQTANFANRMHADLFLHLSFYQEKTIPNHVAIFYYVQNPTDHWHRYQPLYFYPVSQAHLINLKVTEKIAHFFSVTFEQKTINTAFVPLGVFALPYKPLFGITPPALCIQAGLVHQKDWKYIVDPIVQSIKAILL